VKGEFEYEEEACILCTPTANTKSVKQTKERLSAERNIFTGLLAEIAVS
jgi:hypothetical protein